MVRDLQDNLMQTTEMTETTRGFLTHRLLIMDAMTNQNELLSEMIVEARTTVDRDTMAAEGMTAAAVDVTTASEGTTETKAEMTEDTTTSIAMVEDQEEVREMTKEGIETQL